MENDNEGVGAPSGPRVLASHCGDLANLKIFGRDIGIAVVTTAVQAGYLSPLLLEGLAIPPS